MPPYMYPDEPEVAKTETTDGVRDSVTNMSVTSKDSPQVKKKHSNGHIHGNYDL